MNANPNVDLPATWPLRVPDTGGVESCGHTVQFYSDEAFLIDTLANFVGSALLSGGSAIVIATRDDRDALARQLRSLGLDTGTAAARGRFISIDAAETLSQLQEGGRLDAGRFARVVGGLIARARSAAGDRGPVVVFGQIVALLWAEGSQAAAIELEQLWNDLASVEAFDLLCGYPLSLFAQSGDDALLRTVCGVHSRVVPAESYSALSQDDERLLTITLLQQRAQALETEIAVRKQVQTTLERREAELQQANHDLREALEVREEFLSVAAHELRTPMTSLRGYAQLLLRDIQRGRTTPPERLESALAVIEQQTRNLDRLVGRLLDTSQIEAGKLRIEPVTIDLVPIVRSAIAQQRDDSIHTVVFHGPASAEGEVDPLRFEQVVTNLLDNAIQFSPEGGTITVDLARDPSGAIRLTVTDEGIGIPAEQRESVFERFHQAHTGGHLSGIGLGLYIAREIVDLHGGSICIEQPDHTGSRIVVSLPSLAASGRLSRLVIS